MSKLSAAFLATLLALPQAAKAQKKVKIFAFHTAYDQTPQLSNDQLDKVTHVIVHSMPPPADGKFTLESIPSLVVNRLGSVVSEGGPRGVKALLGFGGAPGPQGNPSANFAAMSANATARKTFADNCAAFCREYGVAGVDLDWEFPTDGGSALSLLLDEFRRAFGTTLIVTLSVNPEGLQYYGQALTKADYNLIMSYDNRPPTVAVAQADLNNTGAKVTNKNSLILGVPFYGRTAWPGGNTLEYRAIIKNNPGTAATADAAGGYSFNGTSTIASKTDLIMGATGGGMMIWELSQDYTGATTVTRDTPAGRLQQAMFDQIKKTGSLDKPSTGIRLPPSRWSFSPLRARGNQLVLSAGPGSYDLTLLSAQGRFIPAHLVQAAPGEAARWMIPPVATGAYVYRIQGGKQDFSGRILLGK